MEFNGEVIPKLKSERDVETDVLDTSHMAAYCLFPNEIMKDQQAENRLNEWIEQFNSLLFSNENDIDGNEDTCKVTSNEIKTDNDQSLRTPYLGELENLNTDHFQDFHRSFYTQEKLLTPTELCQEWKKDTVNLRLVGHSISRPEVAPSQLTSPHLSSSNSTVSQTLTSNGSPVALEIGGRSATLNSKFDQWLDINERQIESDEATEEIFAEDLCEDEEVISLDAHKENTSNASSWSFVQGHVVDENISPRHVHHEERIEEAVESIWKELINSEEAHAIFRLLVLQKADQPTKKRVMKKKSPIQAR